MTRIRFHLDENVAFAVATGLRRRGLDVTTHDEAGLSGASDEEHVAYALRESRVIDTHDRHFPMLHAGGTMHAGIAYCAQEKYSIGEAIQMLLLLHDCVTAEAMRGCLEYI